MQERLSNLAEEQVLISKAQQGDRQVFDQLVRRYEHRLIHFLHRCTHDEQSAQDVMQETLLKAYRSLPQFRGESQFYTWLCCIGKNTARTMHRINSRHLAVISDFIDDDDEAMAVMDLLSDFKTPEMYLLNRELLDMLDSTINQLPACLRESILLCEIEGLSYEEIACRQQCPIGTVRSRISRAREMISVHLKHHFGQEKI
jgi:RNA polymerase sigma-70 factor, ECF subfamily